MKKISLIFYFLFFLFSDLFGQKKYLIKHPIYFDVINQYIHVFNMQDSSIVTNSGEQRTERIRVFDLTLKGSMKFIFYDSSLNVIVKGQYNEAVKLSSPKNFSREGRRVRTGKGGIAQFYYNPLRDGVWYYFDDKDVFIKKEVYRKGILIPD